MAYKNTLKDYLKVEMLDTDGKNRKYQLSYAFKDSEDSLEGVKIEDNIKRDPQCLSIKIQ